MYSTVVAQARAISADSTAFAPSNSLIEGGNHEQGYYERPWSTGIRSDRCRTDFCAGNSFTLNSDHSIAAVSVENSADENSSFLMGIGRVTGIAALDAKNPGNASLNFTIFPSGPGSTPVNADGTWADGQIPNKATYTILTFKSKHAQLLDDGKLPLTGDLEVTHVERPMVLSYSEDYVFRCETAPRVPRPGRQG